jgi:hypothetical protein
MAYGAVEEVSARVSRLLKREGIFLGGVVVAEEAPEAIVGDDVCLYVQWVKKLSQCLAVLERLTWHKSNKLCNNLKLIYVILGHLSFYISLNPRNLK